MNIKDLENFYYVSGHKSFSFASKMLGVTQPTLSESIKRLEKELGLTLFYRSKIGISLTPHGEQVLSKVKNLLNIKTEIESVAKEGEKTSQIFKVGCHPIIGRYFLTPFLQILYKKYSKVTIDLIHSHSWEVQRLIQNGKVDIGVVVNPIRNPDLIIRRICYDKICIWKSAITPFRKDQFIADLGLTQIQSILRSWEGAPSRHISSSDFQLIGELTEGGMGYGILPERFVIMEKLRVKKVFPTNFFKDEFSLVYRPEFGKSKVERFFTESLVSCFR